MNPSTDTPRTDAAKSYWDSAERENCVSIVLARELELEAVTYKNEALSLRDSHDLLYRDYQKLEAEVERLKEAMISCLHITNCYDGNYARACDNVDLIVRNALK